MGNEKKNRFLNWIDENKAETAMAITGLCGLAAGFILGMGFENSRMTKEVFEDNIKCLNVFGSSGFKATMSAVEEHVPEAFDMIYKFVDENPGKLDVQGRFFDLPEIRSFIALHRK